MIRGLFISETGEVQELGMVNNWSLIIQAAENALPRLREVHQSTIANQLSEQELEALLMQKRSGAVQPAVQPASQPTTQIEG